MKSADNNNSLTVPDDSSILSDFYTRLPALSHFYDALSVSGADAPPDWFLAITDVVNSTSLIDEGRYKEVNVAGALAIIALARLYGTLKRPYVFGGDGMVFLIDPDHKKQARQVLATVAKDVKNYFGLEMRSAVIPLTRIQSQDKPLRIAKVQESPFYQQAYFLGEAVGRAEKILKNAKIRDEDFCVSPEEAVGEVSYEGFTCRWQDVPSPEGQTGALIVQPRTAGNLSFLVREIEKIIGPPEQHHPLRTNLMKLGGKKSSWKIATVISGNGKRSLIYALKISYAWFEIFVTRILIRLRIPIRFGLYNLARVREQNIHSSDVRKIEGALKMIFTSSPRSMDLLEERLEQLLQQGLLYYGLHRSTSALITCIATLEAGDDVHFVDAADGGYAAASFALKAQMHNAVLPGETNHYGKLSQVYEDVFPLGPKTFDFILENLPSHGSLLDLGCATGEMVRNLSNLGYRAYGIDYTPENISYARARAGEISGKTSSPIFLQGNIFDPGLFDQLALGGPWDTITCLGNTLAHGGSMDELLLLFRGVFGLLKPEGKCIFSMLHYDAILSQPDFYFPKVEANSYEFFREYGHLQNGRLPFTIRLLKEGAEIYESTTLLTPFTLHQLKEAGLKSGFRGFQWYSDFGKNAIETDSLMVVGTFSK